MFSHLNEEEIKRVQRKLKEDLKEVKKGKKRAFYLAEVMNGKIFEFLTEQHLNFEKRFKEEKERAWAFMIDKEQAEKYGFNNHKQKSEDIIAWADIAYPNIEEEVWAVEFEIEYFQKNL